MISFLGYELHAIAVVDPGGAEVALALPGPVKISHKKDDPQRRPHRLHVSRPTIPDRWTR